MKQITIYDLLPLIPKSKFNKYIFFSSHSKEWFICKEKPIIEDDVWKMPAHDICGAFNLSSFINIAPFDGDWQDSLIRIDHFHQKGKMVEEEE